MNEVQISGIVSKYDYSHTIKGVNIYRGVLDIERESGIIDHILFQSWKEDIKVGQMLSITGEIRTLRNEGHPKKLTYVKLKSCRELSQPIYENEVVLSGKLKSLTGIRNTPLGRTIIDFSLQIKEENKYTAYPSLIAWGFTAMYVDSLHEEDEISIKGRLQSREYKRSDGCVYNIQEVSCSEVKVL